MITEFFIWLAGEFVGWFIGLLPDADWSDGMVVSATNAIGSVMVAAGQLSNWFPWATLVGAVTLTLSAFFALFAAKVIKNLAAHIPFVGGKG